MSNFEALIIAQFWSLVYRDKFRQLEWLIYSGYHLSDAVQLIITYYI